MLFSSVSNCDPKGVGFYWLTGFPSFVKVTPGVVRKSKYDPGFKLNFRLKRAMFGYKDKEVKISHPIKII